MAIELKIDGYFEMTIVNYETAEEVDEQEESLVLKRLQEGDYVIGLNNKVIYDIDDFENPKYSFYFDSTNFCEYEFYEL